MAISCVMIELTSSPLPIPGELIVAMVLFLAESETAPARDRQGPLGAANEPVTPHRADNGLFGVAGADLSRAE
jgi:hypothetical protein